MLKSILPHLYQNLVGKYFDNIVFFIVTCQASHGPRAEPSQPGRLEERVMRRPRKIRRWLEQYRSCKRLLQIRLKATLYEKSCCMDALVG